jgi:hypothetical protein
MLHNLIEKNRLFYLHGCRNHCFYFALCNFFTSILSIVHNIQEDYQTKLISDEHKNKEHYIMCTRSILFMHGIHFVHAYTVTTTCIIPYVSVAEGE